MSRLFCVLLAAAVLVACGNEPADVSVEPMDVPEERAHVAKKPAVVSPGERMYRDGVLSTGEPMTAIVAGDVSITGTQFSCESCHGRSGMGASEGDFVVPPVAGQFLFAPSPQPARPAYDRDSMARLLRDGVTPSGRALSVELMPRYEMSDEEVDKMIDFLEELSARDSPGIDATTIRFATVVTDNVNAEKRRAVVGVVQRFGEDINRQTRNDSERWDRGYTPESKLPTVFREWVVDEWLLRGPPDGWAEQLEDYYERAPVFAVVGGVSNGSWQPVSEFCERNKIPCLYPSTDLPQREKDDFYTVYYSRGLWLEADLIRAHLVENPVSTVTQVYCSEQLEPVVTALGQSLTEAGMQVDAIAVECDQNLSVPGSAEAVVSWLDRRGLDALATETTPARLYVSSTQLERNVDDIDGGDEVFAAHPFRLPGKADSAWRRFELWAQSRDVEIVAPRQQAEAFFACLVINDTVKHMGRFRIREFALDMIDHGESMSAYVPLYPRPSFGPGQRYINKGGYILPIVDGQPVASDAAWIIP
ncbi:MAG: cytochrome c [Woeseiaceae bacterium]